MPETKIPFRAVVSSEVLEAITRLVDGKTYKGVHAGHEDQEVALRFFEDLTLVVYTLAEALEEPLKEFARMQKPERVQ